MLTTLTAVDFSVLDWIHQTFSAPLMDLCMVAVTHLGDAGIIWIILALLLCFFRKTRICGILILAGMLIGVLIGNVALKNIIARDRPCWIREMTDLLIAVPQDYSFPSGHTLSSFIAATVLFGFDKRWGILAYLLAALIAFSRLYLFVHFPTDVLAGMLLGITIGVLVLRLAPMLERRLGWGNITQ